jgi:hypothetical protein
MRLRFVGGVHWENINAECRTQNSECRRKKLRIGGARCERNASCACRLEAGGPAAWKAALPRRQAAGEMNAAFRSRSRGRGHAGDCCRGSIHCRIERGTAVFVLLNSAFCVLHLCVRLSDEHRHADAESRRSGRLEGGAPGRRSRGRGDRAACGLGPPCFGRKRARARPSRF